MHGLCTPARGKAVVRAGFIVAPTWHGRKTAAGVIGLPAGDSGALGAGRIGHAATDCGQKAAHTVIAPTTDRRIRRAGVVVLIAANDVSQPARCVSSATSQIAQLRWR